jgi:hypothetical protein
MTVCGGWSLVKHEPGGTRAITLWCRSWTCADCAPYRIADLKRQAMDGKPTTFITLTVNPLMGQSAQERAQQLSDAWKIVVKRARRKFAKAPLEYMAVFEETKKGEPHLHILARAPFIPQRWLSRAMDELISAPIVDIRKVGHVKNAARYVAKYVGKGPKAFAALKRYWASHGYSLSEKPKPEKHDHPTGGWQVWKEPLIVVMDVLRCWCLKPEWISDSEIFAPLRAPPWREG